MILNLSPMSLKKDFDHRESVLKSRLDIFLWIRNSLFESCLLCVVVNQVWRGSALVQIPLIIHAPSSDYYHISVWQASTSAPAYCRGGNSPSPAASPVDVEFFYWGRPLATLSTPGYSSNTDIQTVTSEHWLAEPSSASHWLWSPWLWTLLEQLWSEVMLGTLCRICWRDQTQWCCQLHGWWWDQEQDTRLENQECWSPPPAGPRISHQSLPWS